MYRLLKLFSIFLIAALCTGQVWAQSAADRLLAAEQQRFNAMIKKDTRALEGMIEEGLVYIHSNGLIQDKAAFIGTIEKGTMVYETITVKERTPRIYGKTGVINGIVHVKGMLNGTPFDIDLRFTDVYTRKKGWKMVSWQSLKIVS